MYMKLSKRNLLLVSFMLFSLFFGAGNLIFPPFLGQNAGGHTIPALIGFLATAVILPVLGVIVVSESNGLDKLANRVNPRFSIVFTVLIYLSIGPGLGIPRAASVPFEMAVAPYLPEGSNINLFMLLYSLVFFLLAGWLSMTPRKLVKRVGTVLTPSLLILLVFLFISFLFRGTVDIAAPQAAYESTPLLTGFCEGYNTMDTIAALNFGLVIATTLRGFGLDDKKSVVSYTVKSGIFAGSILTGVYLMLTYMGTCSSGVYPIQGNGAWTLRCIVAQLFGEPGAILLAAIFTLACLTTCVGLITSISQFFTSLLPKVSYKALVIFISVFSFVVCNQGLNTILSLSMPVLNAIYPMSIMLILLGLTDRWCKKVPHIYSITLTGVGIISVLYALDTLHVPLGFLSDFLHLLPFAKQGFAWVTVAIVMVAIALVLKLVKKEPAAEQN